MKKILTKEFFERPVLEVAEKMLGKFLCTQLGGRTAQCFMICEVEVYDGFKDKASHAHKGMTKRNAPMFGEAGRWYVYFTYGMHWMLNIVTGPKNYPAAILLRGVLKDSFSAHDFSRHAYSPAGELLCSSRCIGTAQGLEKCVPAKNLPKSLINSLVVLNGPAKLTKFLKIDKCFNDKLASKKTGLWIEDRDVKIPKNRIRRASRVGVDYAGEWSRKKYRFFIDFPKAN